MPTKQRPWRRSGRMVARVVLPTEEAPLLEFVRTMRGAVHVAIEVGTQAQWLHDLLKPTRISKTGNHHLRRALYMPALVASRHEPHVHRFYQDLVDREKTRLQAIVAVMRKPLHAIYGMLKHDRDFDGTKFRAIAA